jgi:hypothetical protein
MQSSPDKIDYLLMVPSCCGGPVGRAALAFRAAPGRPPQAPDRKDEAADRLPKPAAKPRSFGEAP